MQHSMHFSKATLACWLAPAVQRNVRGFVQQLLEWTTLRRLITSEWSNYAVQGTRAVVSGFLGAWTDPMGNNVQVKEVCNEVRV